MPVDLQVHAEVEALIHRYTQHVRTKNMDGAPALFSDEALFVVQSPEGEKSVDLKGRHAIVDFLGASVGRGDVFISPLIHNLLVEARGDEASSSCVMVAAARNGSPLFMGVYEDSFRRESGAWVFTARIFTMLGSQFA